MPFIPIAKLPTERAQGAASGLVRPSKLAQQLGFKPSGAWLFAYMFRRFGPPNAYSDDHKNIATWCLTTPKRGCYLTVTPYLGDKGDDQPPLSFGYLLTEALHEAAQKAPPATRREWRIWWDKVFRWADKRKVSIVADKDLDRRKPLNQFGYGEANSENTRRWFVWTNKADKATRPVELNLRMLKTMPLWMASDISRTYTKKHPKAKRPPYPHENPTVLGYINKALSATLKELMRPIFVRDISFDPVGRVEETQLRSAEPYEHAGYPCQSMLPKKPEQLPTSITGLAAIAFAKTCCDKPEDRMWHAADNTWWCRKGNHWRTAEPPPRWHQAKSGKSLTKRHRSKTNNATTSATAAKTTSCCATAPAGPTFSDGPKPNW